MLVERSGFAAMVLLAASAFPLVAGAGDPGPAKDCALVRAAPRPDPAMAAAKRPFPPVQLDMRIPFAPTPFPSGGFEYLVYEVHLQNYTGEPLALRGLEVLDAGTGNVLAAFADAQLYARMRSIGVDKIDGDHPLGSGRSAVAFICLAFGRAFPVPDKLNHRALVGDAVAEGPAMEVGRVALKVLAPPVGGADWVADNGPSLDSHHRTGLFVAGGGAHLSRRFAIDWKQVKQGLAYSGDARDVRAYHAYGENVLAVADASVVSAKDGFPDNVPRTAAGFDTAVPLTMENVAGNAVVLDLGDGQFAYYAHLKPGSVRVKTGDRVRRGDLLAQIGNSGDARWPHLHFQVTMGPDILASEGMPFVIDRFRARDDEGAWKTRTREYPMGNIAVDLREDGAATP